MPDEVDDRDAVGARGLGTGSGSNIRLLGPDIVDSVLTKLGGANPWSVSVVSEPFEVPAS